VAHPTQHRKSSKLTPDFSGAASTRSHLSSHIRESLFDGGENRVGADGESLFDGGENRVGADGEYMVVPDSVGVERTASSHNAVNAHSLAGVDEPARSVRRASLV
jgi:hypothetical protein